MYKWSFYSGNVISVYSRKLRVQVGWIAMAKKVELHVLRYDSSIDKI